MLEITLTLVLVLVGVVYVFMTWNFGYWQKRNVPGPKPKIFTGNYPNMYTMKKHVIYDIDKIYRDYKQQYDAVGVYGARSPQLMVISPELARRVFVSDFKSFHDNELSLMINEKTDFIFANNPFSLVGEEWKSRRADVTPGLTPGRIKTVYPVTNEVCSKMSNWLEKQIQASPPEGINAKDLCLRFTTEMVTDCVLGLKAESFTDNPTPIMGHIKDLFTQPWTFLLYFVLISTFPALRALIKLRFIPLATEKFFVSLMQGAIDARRAQLSAGKQFERVDFLDYILQLAEKRNLDTRRLTAHTMTFLLDGFETTAGVLSHLLMLLGRNQQAQQRLRDEIKAHLNTQGVVEFDKLNELPFLDACVQESIRLFPPAFMSNKLCTETIELPNKNGDNFTVEPGTTVIVPHYCFMVDEEHFPNPQEFQPDRFMQPDAAKMYRERGVFMGFGDGPRVCIGMRFALAQIKAATVELLTKFDVHVNPKTRKDNSFEPTSLITTLEGGIWLDFKQRQ
ncbi:probable cytochrome P450 28a5 [Drosophila sulfurigaster albostrigata]|uniref:probable cytochrome P450 28a5 n=1 Tax=Drosophila sulfurigaster albostrigata TaxID=89887 RepID=UPI002D21D69A|nr:probable cytochrome P450 28a5 [Drosophila sulfurigaster albostrigata]